MANKNNAQKSSKKKVNEDVHEPVKKRDLSDHDRFLIIDDKVYFMGASLKDMGAGLCAVTEMQIIPETLLNFLK